MKLYGAKLSSSTRRVALTAALLGIEPEPVTIELRGDRTKLAALNPNNKIPVLDDDGFVLWESHAIMEYLCERTPGQTLLPTEPRARADVRRWLYWTSAHLSPATGGLAFERMWKKMISGGDPDATLVAYHERFLHQFLKVLDDHLATRSYVSGDRLSLAELSLACTLMYAERASLPIAQYGNVQALRSRVAELPAWKQTEPMW